MKLRDLRKIQKIIKHLRRSYPNLELSFVLETKFFYYISVSDPYVMLEREFMRRRDIVRVLHGIGLSKKLLFITKGQYIKKK